LLPATTSPLIDSLLAAARAVRPRLGVAFHSAALSPHPLAGARLAFGKPVVCLYDFAPADVVVSLDADFLGSGPFWLANARAWAERRRAPDPGRLYLAETAWSPTGSLADHRLRARPSEIAGLATALLDAVRGGGAPANSWVRAAARDLSEHRGSSLVIVGERQPPEVHAIGHALNALLGNAGKTVSQVESPYLAGATITEFAAALDAGGVKSLFILGGDPAYDTPADLGLAGKLARVPRALYLGVEENDTAHVLRGRDRWVVPALHPLESWGDAQALDGTISLLQPLVGPLVPGLQAEELLAALANRPQLRPHELLRGAWRKLDDAAWERALQRGFIDGTSAPRLTLAANPNPAPLAGGAPPPVVSAGLELALVADAKLHDGAFASNPWLLELPAPATQLTWDNAALVSPATAERLLVASGDLVELGFHGGKLRAPILVQPGHADDAVTLALGWGRAHAGAGSDVGTNAYLLRASDALFGGPGLTVDPLPWRRELAVTQEKRDDAGRPVALTATLAEVRARGDEVTRGQKKKLPTLLEDHYTPQAKNQWAMSIDLSVCTGCSACVVACQAENNTPTVGKEGVRRSREMHWLRVDRYLDGERAVSQPMMCQHCEKAPCEYVCPVGATVHSDDGLNEMVYNRCIGTRFCSNNCPYKVRRFNFFDYVAADRTALQKNPDVTVRARGVMEKCTYCVQRIRRAEIDARLARRELGADEVKTACQQACPTQAITFGSLGDPASSVSRAHADLRSYRVLNDLGTKPRTEYLVKIINPDPELGS
jgi:molybdopterin-containing oxidoreductase family iron-sulfur binding subunit